MNARTRIEETNLRACTLLGVNRRNLIHQPLMRYISSDDANRFHRHRRDVLKTRTEQSCQELLTNVARHAQATAVNITLQEQAGGLVLEVRDNGHGVTQAELSDPTSLGLVGMRERALLMGGEIAFTGSPGKGTTVRARIVCDSNTVKGGVAALSLQVAVHLRISTRSVS